MIAYYIQKYYDNSKRLRYKVHCSYTGKYADRFHLHSYFETREMAQKWVEARKQILEDNAGKYGKEYCARCNHDKHENAECTECSCQKYLAGCPNCFKPLSTHTPCQIQKGSMLHRQLEIRGIKTKQEFDHNEKLL